MKYEIYTRRAFKNEFFLFRTKDTKEEADRVVASMRQMGLTLKKGNIYIKEIN